MRSSAPSLPDPGRVWNDLNTFSNGGLAPNRDVSGKTERFTAINPALKTLVLISAGQSLASDALPTNFVPTNASAIDNFDPQSGGMYAAADPLLGTTLQAAGVGVANYNLRLADLFITNGVFNRVIIVPVAAAATSIIQWAGPGTPGYLVRNIQSAALKLRSRGITPTTTGATFAITWHQGESDTQAGTSQAAYTAAFLSMKAQADVYLPGVRWFVSRESWLNGVTSSAVQAAQAAVIDNVTVFALGDWDAGLNSGHRVPDNTHLNDAGGAQGASLDYVAMRASGSPF